MGRVTLEVGTLLLIILASGVLGGIGTIVLLASAVRR
jgi:hypothetical protein